MGYMLKDGARGIRKETIAILNESTDTVRKTIQLPIDAEATDAERKSVGLYVRSSGDLAFAMCRDERIV